MQSPQAAVVVMNTMINAVPVSTTSANAGSSSVTSVITPSGQVVTPIPTSGLAGISAGTALYANPATGNPGTLMVADLIGGSAASASGMPNAVVTNDESTAANVGSTGSPGPSAIGALADSALTGNGSGISTSATGIGAGVNPLDLGNFF
jgi:hypothetical protein